MLLSLLIEREKIVQSKDGFFLHSRWLEEIISKLKEHSGKELTVSDFKKMTGLSRKYAIPLLELLDQMGITRRISPSRRVIG
jgi:selenocysteine-specific elongation factor